MTLFIEQKAAIEKLSRLRAGALFMEMGTGKTRTAIELARGKQDDFSILVWIAPASLLADSGYISEINRWSGGIQCLIRYFSIEGISQSDRSFMSLRQLAANHRVFCIVDESLTIKNTIAKRSQRLLNMWNLFDFRLILNGTPLSKGLIDLYAQIQFLHPKILNMDETQFAHNFLQFRKEGYRPWAKWSLPANEEALVEIIRPYIFDAELDLNVSAHISSRRFLLTPDETDDYRRFKKWFLDKNPLCNFLAVAQAFQQHYTMCAGKKKFVRDLLPKLVANGEKTLVFVKFHKELDWLKNTFDCAEYSGRKKDYLGRHAPVLSCTYGTGSKGLNLQAYQNIVFFTQTFDWAHKKHGLHRVLRKGQKKNVQVYDLWVKTGLESIIENSLGKKTSVTSHVSALIDNKQALAL